MPDATVSSVTQKLRQVLTDDKSFTTTLLILFMDTYGPEGLDWAPETIYMEIEDDFGVKMPERNFDKLMAGIYLISSDSFYKSLPDFIEICNVLAGHGVTPGQFEPVALDDMAWGLTEALLISPPDDRDTDPFSDE